MIEHLLQIFVCNIYSGNSNLISTMALQTHSKEPWSHLPPMLAPLAQAQWESLGLAPETGRWGRGLPGTPTLGMATAKGPDSERAPTSGCDPLFPRGVPPVRPPSAPALRAVLPGGCTCARYGPGLGPRVFAAPQRGGGYPAVALGDRKLVAAAPGGPGPLRKSPAAAALHGYGCEMGDKRLSRPPKISAPAARSRGGGGRPWAGVRRAGCGT